MNKFEKRSMAAYNKKANHYDDTFDGKFTMKFKAILLETVKIQNGDTVLDVAGGNGRLLSRFVDQYAFKGYGTDISDKMIEQAKTLNLSMEFLTASCDKLPFTQNKWTNLYRRSVLSGYD